MSFEVGKPIDSLAADQILLRQDVIGDQYRLARPDLAYGYYFEKTPWIKLSSGVNIDNSQAGKRIARTLLGDENLTGDVLARENVLFNLTEIQSPDQLSQTIQSKGLPDLPGYEDSTTQGIRPLPGIISMNLRTHNTFGSVRTATVNFVCWTVQQLEVLEVLYMRPGYTALLEWGHSRYLYEEDGSAKTDSVGAYGIDFFGTKKKRSEITKQLLEQRLKYRYNYDGMYGLIKNFSWSLRPDGGYDCRMDVVSTGELIESLKINIGITDGIKGIKAKQNQPPVVAGPNKTVTLEQAAANGDSFDKFANADKDARAASAARAYGQTTAVQDNTDPAATTPSVIPDEPLIDVATPDSTDSNTSLLHYILLSKIEQYIYNTLSYFKTTGYREGQFQDELLKAIFTDNLTNVSDIDNNYRGYIYAIFDGAAEPEEGSSEPELTAFYYLKLGLLVEIINRTILTSTTLEEPFFVLETERTRFKYKTFDNHVSIDPQICLLPDTLDTYVDTVGAKKTLREIDPLLPTTAPGTDTIPPTDDEGLNILDIYVNIRNITSTLNSFIDGEGEVTLYSFLESLLKSINIATGGVSNLQLQYFEDTAKYAIVDRNFITKFSAEISRINISGRDSIVRNFNLTSKLSPRIGTMVAISAQASPYSTGIEATGLAFLNRGLQDRIIVERTDPQASKVKKQKEEDLTKEITLELEKLVEVQKAIIELYGKLTNPDGTRKYTYSDGQIRSAVSQYSTYVAYATGQVNNPAYSFIIPFELELTLEGISGFKIMESFRVNKIGLPYTYRGTDANDIAFLITGLEHQVTSQSWNTVVRSQLYITGPTHKTKVHVLRDLKQAPTEQSTSSLGDRSRGTTQLSAQETTDFFKDVYTGLGVTAPNSFQLRFFEIWRQKEGAQAAWNPFNTTQKTADSSFFNRITDTTGVQNYTTRKIGIDATVKTLKNGYYTDLIEKIKAIKSTVDIKNAMRALDKSPWGTRFKDEKNIEAFYVQKFSDFMWSGPIVKR